MKRIIFAVLFGVASLSSINTQAQVSVNINIGSQPQWGPAGYNHVDYYYLPDVDAYYYVPSHQYIYQNNGSWVWRNSLPSRYSNFDLYNSYKVVINQPRPYLSHQSHIQQYSKYKNYGGKQGVIRDSKDSRYTAARNNNTVNRNQSYTHGNSAVKNKTVIINRGNSGRPAQNNKPGNNQNNGRGNNNNNNNRQGERQGRGH